MNQRKYFEFRASSNFDTEIKNLNLPNQFDWSVDGLALEVTTGENLRLIRSEL